MNPIVDLHDYRYRHSPPTLVLVDMHEEHLGIGAQLAIDDVIRVLAQCRSLVTHSRNAGWSIAFVRSLRISASGRKPSAPKWIQGLAPRRHDMVFDRDAPSCYAHAEFADSMAQAGGAFALAGFSAGTVCLTTILDAFHRGHRATLISDASASEKLSGFAPAEGHRAILALAGRYAQIATAAEWIESASKSFQQQRSPHALV